MTSVSAHQNFTKQQDRVIYADLGLWRTWLLYQSGRSWQHLSWACTCPDHLTRPEKISWTAIIVLNQLPNSLNFGRHFGSFPTLLYLFSEVLWRCNSQYHSLMWDFPRSRRLAITQPSHLSMNELWVESSCIFLNPNFWVWDFHQKSNHPNLFRNESKSQLIHFKTDLQFWAPSCICQGLHVTP